LSPHFFDFQYFLSPSGLKREEKISYIKSVFLMYDNLLCVKQKRFENEGGCGKVGQVEGQNVHERGVGWPMLFLRAKRIPGDGVINKIF
jgi:hypothetical protein